MATLKGRLLALKSQLIPCPTPAAIIRQRRIAGLPQAIRNQFLEKISGYKLGHKNLVDDALLQAEWDAGIVTAQELHAILSARIAQRRTEFRLTIEQGFLRLLVEGTTLRLRFYQGRIPQKSLVIARHSGSGWRMEAMEIDLRTFIASIQAPRPQTEPWKPKPCRGRIGSVPVGWK